MKFYLEPEKEADCDSDGESGHFYALAVTSGVYYSARNKIPAEFAIYFSPTKGFSRFSLHIFSCDGRCIYYRQGPDYTNSVETMLFMLSLPSCGIPPHVWSLVSSEKCTDFFCKEHEIEYFCARKDFARALYFIRLDSSPIPDGSHDPLCGPPDGNWPVFSIFDNTLENKELIYSNT